MPVPPERPEEASRAPSDTARSFRCHRIIGDCFLIRCPAMADFQASGIALCLMWALGEMTVAHPVAGSFGVHSEMYLHPWAGFTMRYSYWLAQVIAIGSEMIAASI